MQPFYASQQQLALRLKLLNQWWKRPPQERLAVPNSPVDPLAVQRLPTAFLLVIPVVNPLPQRPAARLTLLLLQRLLINPRAQPIPFPIVRLPPPAVMERLRESHQHPRRLSRAVGWPAARSPPSDFQSVRRVLLVQVDRVPRLMKNSLVKRLRAIVEPNLDLLWGTPDEASRHQQQLWSRSHFLGSLLLSYRSKDGRERLLSRLKNVTKRNVCCRTSMQQSNADSIFWCVLNSQMGVGA